MFTGLVEAKGTIKTINLTPQGAKVFVCSNFDNLKLGESVAVNGACHTVTEVSPDFFAFDTMKETLRLTNLKYLKTGDSVNLERAMKATGRFDGHFVSGHVDGVAKLANIKQDGFASVYKFEYPNDYIVYKGSVCLNGVSLTVSAIGDNFFEVSLIPHTLRVTNLGDLKVGDFVNIEVDIIAKYIEKFTVKNKRIDENFLKECGF